MVSSGLLRRVALVSTDGSEELSASFIRESRIDELGTNSSETSVIRRAKRRNIPKDAILHIEIVCKACQLLP
jgi:hypothetical protein